jgi:hypothetical protein
LEVGTLEAKIKKGPYFGGVGVGKRGMNLGSSQVKIKTNLRPSSKAKLNELRGRYKVYLTGGTKYMVTLKVAFKPIVSEKEVLFYRTNT